MINIKANVTLFGKNKIGEKFISKNGSLFTIQSSLIRGKKLNFLFLVMSVGTGEVKLVDAEYDKMFIVKFM
jgi:hypothetical protein